MVVNCHVKAMPQHSPSISFTFPSFLVNGLSNALTCDFIFFTSRFSTLVRRLEFLCEMCRQTHVHIVATKLPPPLIVQGDGGVRDGEGFPELSVHFGL